MSVNGLFEDRKPLSEKSEPESPSPSTSRRRRCMLLPNALGGPFKTLLVLGACICTIVYFSTRSSATPDLRECEDDDCSSRGAARAKPLGPSTSPDEHHSLSQPNHTGHGGSGSHGKALRKGLVLASYIDQDVAWLKEIDPV